MNAFETWWYNEGSAAPIPGEDGEEHLKRMCQIAWENGSYLMREACALKCEQAGIDGYGTLAAAALIRKMEDV